MSGMKLQSIHQKNIKHGTNILEVHVPKELERSVKSGLPWFDELYGGEGFTPSQMILYTGSPGVGKTTSCLQLADAITANGNICLYNTGEESPLQVRKTAKRLGLKSGFVIGQDTLVADIMLHLEELRKSNPNKQVFFICDSLATMNDGHYSNGIVNSMTQVRVTELLTDYCKAKFVVGFLVGHATKNDDFAGKMQIKHTVDTHMHFSFDRDKKSETYGKRILTVSKNRFGPAGITYVIDMDSSGLHVVDHL